MIIHSPRVKLASSYNVKVEVTDSEMRLAIGQVYLAFDGV